MRRLIGPVLWTSDHPAGRALAFLRLLDRQSGYGREIAGILGAIIAMLLPLAFLVGLARSRLVRGEALGRMLERVAHESDPVKMQEAVAEALGDPSVEIAFWLPDTAGYVDARGLPIAELIRIRTGRQPGRWTAEGSR